jgi:dipeptidyl aminopeptidase/acylaminoacyl peptidase
MNDPAYPSRMERDLRETPLYREVESFFRRVLEPGFGKISDPSDPQPSPDGGSIAFRGERRDTLEGHPDGRICLVGVDGSGFRQITNGPHDDDQPRWSPDGGTLTFRSDRAAPGRHQLYELVAEAIGEARALPVVEGVAEQHAWSPDGSRILVVVAGLDAEQSDAVGSGTVATDEDVPAWVPSVESSDRAEGTRRRLCTIDVATGTVAPVGRPELNVWEAVWCGDDRIAAIVSDDPGESAWYGARLVTIDVAGGTDRTILESDVQLGWVHASPDGRRLAVVEALCSDRLVVAGELLLVDPEDGELVRVDTSHVDVAGVAWRDDEHLLVIGVRDLDSVVLDVDAKTGTATERWATQEAGGVFFIAATPVGEGFALVLQSASRPPELVAVDRTGEATIIAHTTHSGTELIVSSIGSRRRVSWAAPDGLPISGILTLPAGDPPFPLILAVHGGPVWAYQDFWPGELGALLAARGYAVLMANPRGSWGRGREFAAKVVGDMGGADAQDLLAGIDHIISLGIADPERIGVTGGSYGGFMSAWLPSIDQRFRAAVAISPVTDWYSERFDSNLGTWAADFLGGDPVTRQEHYHERSPVFAAGWNRTPTLLTAGARDRATPTGQAVEFHRALREHGVPSDVVVYPLEGHGVRDLPAAIDLAARTLAWFERFMPPDAPAR